MSTDRTSADQERALREQYALKLQQGAKKVDQYTDQLANKYKAGVTSGISTALSGSNFSSESDALQLDVLSDSDYVDYARSLDKSREEVKQRWSAANDKYKKAGDELLDSYRKLWTLRKLTSDQTSDPTDPSFEGRQKGRNDVDTKMNETLKTIENNKIKHDDAREELECEDRTFRLFQQDQGRVISTVEKHKVHQVRQQRASMRVEAHVAIMRALNNSPVMGELPAEEREQFINEVVALLHELENVEGETDELVQRLELKVQAIHMNELQQNTEIEESLTRQSQINDELEQLNSTVMNNNEKLSNTYQKFSTDIAQRIQGLASASLFSPRTVGGVALIVIALIVGLLTILALNKKD